MIYFSRWHLCGSNKNCQSRKRNIRTGQMHYRDQGNLMSKECSRPHICIMQMLVCQDLIIRVNTNMHQDCKVCARACVLSKVQFGHVNQMCACMCDKQLCRQFFVLGRFHRFSADLRHFKSGQMILPRVSPDHLGHVRFFRNEQKVQKPQDL